MIVYWKIWAFVHHCYFCVSPFPALFFLTVTVICWFFSVHFFMHSACHHHFCNSQKWVHSCFMLAQDKSLDICAIALEVLYFVTKHTCSILGSAFLSFHMVCNSKILPNTMWSLWCWQCCSIAYWNGSDSYGKIKKWFLMAESIPSPRTKWLIVVKTFFVVHYAGVCIPKFLCPGNSKGASLLANLAKCCLSR